jgi:hypothetical protein
VIRNATDAVVEKDSTGAGDAFNGMLLASIAAFVVIIAGPRWSVRWWNAAMIALVSFWVVWLTVVGVVHMDNHDLWAQREIRLLNLLGPLALSVPFFLILRSRTPISSVARDRAWRVLAVASFAQMQWLGECPDPWPINSEIGTLADEMPFGHHWFRFMRYDLGLERPWFLKYLDKDLMEDAVAGYRNMDDPSIIQTIYEHACEAAERQVKVEHFFPKK